MLSSILCILFIKQESWFFFGRAKEFKKNSQIHLVKRERVSRQHNRGGTVRQNFHWSEINRLYAVCVFPCWWKFAQTYPKAENTYVKQIMQVQ